MQRIILFALSLLAFSCLNLNSAFAQTDQSDYLKLTNEHRDDVEVLAVSPNGKYLATGSWDHTITVYRKDSSYEWMSTLRNHRSAVTCLTFSRDSKYLMSGSNDYRTVVWKLTEEEHDFQIDTVFENVHNSPITDVLIGPGMRMFYTSGADGKVVAFDRMKKKARTIDNKSPIQSIALSTNRRFVFVTDESTLVKQYDAFGKVIRTYEGHEDYVNDVEYALNNRFIATASNDKTIKLWDPLNGKNTKTFEGHDWKVTCLAISRDSKYLLSGSSDGTAIMWNIETGEAMKTFEGHGTNVRSVAFSPKLDEAFIALHVEENDTEYGIIVWKTGIAPPKVGKAGGPPPLPKHLQKYAPKRKTPTKSKAKPKTAPKSAGKIIKETDEVIITED